MAAQNEESKGLGGSAYARRTKRLIKLIGNIRALGGQGVVDLPRIAVIGNQSAGKSSLIEAISGITVPRSVGTCTRCPMECRLTQQSGSKWRAQVFLRRETEADGRPAKDVQERVFGNVIESNEELEVMIRRAQLAILNPSVAPDHFLTIDLEVPAASSSHRKDELAFSSNVVCVTVWGPDVPDLSFIDLPGIIQNETEKGSMNAVKSMVMKHIQGNCLILLAIVSPFMSLFFSLCKRRLLTSRMFPSIQSMRDDIENQSAAYLAKHVDPSGLRTLGVLTKSDLVQEGEERGWLDILEGRVHRLHHGYFITKQPAPKDVEEKITHAAARAAERRYFAEHPLWADRSAEVRSRMGTVQLGQTLSKLLSQLINRTLPTLREDVLTQLALTQKRLSEFPQKLSQPPAVALLKLVGNYCQEIGQLVQGSPSHRELMQTCNPAFNLFRLRIRGTAPNFVASTRAEAQKAQKKTHAGQTGVQRSGSKSAPIVIDTPIKQISPPRARPETFVFGVTNSSTTAAPTFSQTPNPFALNSAGGAASTPRPISAAPPASSSSTSTSPRPQSNGVAPSKLPIEPEAMGIDEPGEESEDSDGGMTEDLLRQPSPKKVADPMYLDDIRKLVESHLTRELPFNVPFGAKVEAMTMCFEQWGNLSESCAETVIKAARNLTSGLSNKVFGGFKYGELDRTVKIVVESQIDKLAAQVKGRLVWLAEMEKVPYTLNKHYFQSYMDKYFKKYKAERQKKIFSGEDKSDAIAQARALQFSSKDIEAIVAALRGPDPYEHELMVAAEVRAYFQVSYKRIIDNVPRIIDHDFIRLLRPSIESALHEKFFSDERSAGRYMAEDPEIVVFREDLETKLGRLLEISARLERSLDDD
ncbi:P-loop containing nucleoside triphosphate hydrolase protein [Clavulina sp. PMI_390]|nr:P-loop containing nucleoside triphosphate hydrolase protein [Clavulina sp. PMI_390]